MAASQGLGWALRKWEGRGAAQQTPARGSGVGELCTGIPDSWGFPSRAVGVLLLLAVTC